MRGAARRLAGERDQAVGAADRVDRRDAINPAVHAGAAALDAASAQARKFARVGSVLASVGTG